MLNLRKILDLLPKRYPFEKQRDSTDCGIACLRMISKHYGGDGSYENIKSLGKLTRQGVTMETLQDVAEKLNFKALAVKLELERLLQAPLPAILLWNSNHFTVLYSINDNGYLIADPGCGLHRYGKEEFLKCWIGDQRGMVDQGISLLLEPTKAFMTQEKKTATSNRDSLQLVTKHFRKFAGYFTILAFGLLLGSIVQLAFPFLTQAIVDYGVKYKNTEFILLMLFGLLFFYTSSIVVDFIRSRILIHVGSRLNILLISDFLSKLMRLPLSYFESNVVGDLIQRIRDHKRIETFVTDSLVKSLFSIFNIAILSTAIIFFSPFIFTIFCTGTILETIWVLSFMSRIRIFDNRSFQLQAEEQNKTYEILTGIQEIKLNNLEALKKKHWEATQFELFHVNIKKLKLDQMQKGGQRFLNNLQVTLIIFFAALAVVHSQMSLGTMMALIFIQG